MSTLRFALYAGPTDSLQHLVLLNRQRELMHWVLPAAAGRQATGLLGRGLLLEAPAAELNRPTLVAQGACQQSGGALPSTSSGLRAALATGRLLLTFSGNGLQGTYSLIRLHATSPAWLLSPVTYLPGPRQSHQQAAPGPVAPRAHLGQVAPASRL
jgi:hypothetical protein